MGAAALALATFAGACAADSEADVAVESPTTSAQSSAAPETGTQLPALEPSGTIDGSQLDWASLEGKDVMLWFWAPW